MSLPTGVLNFALITNLPHHHLLSLFHVHGVAVSPPARPRAAPSPLPRPWLLSKRLGLSTRRHLPARTLRMDARRATATTRRVVPCANSPLACALCWLSSLPCASQMSLLPPPLLPVSAPGARPSFPASRAATSAAPPKAAAGLPPPPSHSSNKPRERLHLTPTELPSPAKLPPSRRSAAAGRRRPRTARHRLPQPPPRPSAGAARTPLHFPQPSPHLRCLSSPENGRPTLPCSVQFHQGPPVRRNRNPGA